jgi:hypothetical protein
MAQRCSTGSLITRGNAAAHNCISTPEYSGTGRTAFISGSVWISLAITFVWSWMRVPGDARASWTFSPIPDSSTFLKEAR